MEATSPLSLQPKHSLSLPIMVTGPLSPAASGRDSVAQTRPFTAEQLVQLLPEISRATVYRTLEIMASVDILTRLLQSNGHPAYVVGEPGTGTI